MTTAEYRFHSRSCSYEYISGIGSEAQRPLALVIVGGMVTTTILTLLVFPVIYRWFRGRILSQTAKA